MLLDHDWNFLQKILEPKCAPRMSKICGRLFQDFVGPPELPVFAFQRFTSIPVSSGFPVPLTAVRLSASNPSPKRIRTTAHLGRNRFDRSRLGV
jgi:hypothetical protein